MATLTLFFDTRRAKESEYLPLSFVIRSGKTSASIPTGIKLKPIQWKDGRVVHHPEAKALNLRVKIMAGELADAIRETCSFDSGLTAQAIRDRIRKLTGIDAQQSLAASVEEAFERFIPLKDKESTIESFKYTLSLINQYVRDASKFCLDDVSVEWLHGFEKWLLEPPASSGRKPVKRNTCAIHLENLRAVVNFAIGEGLTTQYAFKKFKIRREASVKRSLTLDEMQRLWNYVGRTETERWYADMFKLSFCLCGMNVKDMYELQDSDVVNGRIERNRSKTAVHISLKLEDEALAIIERWKGKNGHLVNIADKYRYSHRDFLSRCNRGLKIMGPVLKREGLGGRITEREPLFPNLTTYWARHTWATIASELGVPIETISMGLGHEYGSAVTNIYIRPNLKKLDEANRMVLDAVTGKTPSPESEEVFVEDANTGLSVAGWGSMQYVYS